MRPAGPTPSAARTTQRAPASGKRVVVRHVEPTDERAFVQAARRSHALHGGWVTAPQTGTAFRDYVARFVAPAHHGFVVLTAEGEDIAGAINLTNIVMGSFRSGCLGYFAFAGFERRGLMAEGLAQVCRIAFRRLKLHRVEANIQPDNQASIALARACGFRREGYSPRYLKIGGRWRDHERWALLADR